MSRSQRCQQLTLMMSCPESCMPLSGCPASHPRTTGASYHLCFPAKIHAIPFRTPSNLPLLAGKNAGKNKATCILCAHVLARAHSQSCCGLCRFKNCCKSNRQGNPGSCYCSTAANNPFYTPRQDREQGQNADLIGVQGAGVWHIAHLDGADLVRRNNVGVRDGGAQQHFTRNLCIARRVI